LDGFFGRLKIFLDTIRLSTYMSSAADVAFQLQKLCDEKYNNTTQHYEFVLYVLFSFFISIFSRKELPNMSCALSYTKILHDSTYLIFRSEEGKMFGAYEMEYGKISWKHISATESYGNFKYTIKTANKPVNIEKKKPFGPLTSLSLKRRVENPDICLNFFCISISFLFLIVLRTLEEAQNIIVEKKQQDDKEEKQNLQGDVKENDVDDISSSSDE
jgi:hypothetical protein